MDWDRRGDEAWALLTGGGELRLDQVTSQSIEQCEEEEGDPSSCALVTYKYPGNRRVDWFESGKKHQGGGQ